MSCRWTMLECVRLSRSALPVNEVLPGSAIFTGCGPDLSSPDSSIGMLVLASVKAAVGVKAATTRSWMSMSIKCCSGQLVPQNQG